MTATPTNLALEGESRLLIEWSDGRRRVYDVVELRRACPCATCNTGRSRAEETGHDPPDIAPDITIRGMKPIGNYAYGIRFSDGHDTGIFTLNLLRSLGTEVKAQ
jgi:DUF971 family protein